MNASPPAEGGRQLHSRLEDLLALAFGCVFVATGLAILRGGGLVTGGMAGLALLATHFVALPPGLMLALLNLPFLALAWRAIGPLFALRTVLVSIGIAAISALAQSSIRIGIDSPVIAAISGGALLGQGVLTLVRHGAGLGGLGVLTIWFNQKFGWRLGRSQIAIDVIILALSGFILEPAQLGWSALSALVMGLEVYLWHRPGLYTGYSQVRW